MTATSGARRCVSWISTTPSGNDWLAVNQVTVVENKHERRPDIVLFVNGLPLGLIELKNPANGGRDRLDRLAAAPDLQGRAAVALRHERGAHRLRWA